MSLVQKEQEAVVAAYYEKATSRIGYTVLLGDERHFGIHPTDGTVLPDHAARAAKRAKIAASLGVRSGQKILDVGCGSGVVSRKLAADYGVRVDGISITPRDVRLAQRRAALQHLPNRYWQQSVLDMTFAQTYDGTYTTEVLSHVADIPAALQNMYKAIRPGGRITLCEYSLMDDEKIQADEALTTIAHLGDIVINTSGLYGIKQVRHGGWAPLVENAGFTDVATEDLTTQVVPSIERLRRLTQVPRAVMKMMGTLQNHPGSLTALYLPLLCEADVFRYAYVTGTKPE